MMRQEPWRSGQLRWTAGRCGAKLIGMIATLEGLVAEKIGQSVILDVGGVGYGLLVSFEDFGALKIGAKTKLYVHEAIRDNAYELFGFRTEESKRLFEQLLSVKGIGPRMALAILSVASLSHVRQAIAGGDTKFISQAKGVGRKAAERVVVDLKDKVGLQAAEQATDFLTTAADPGDEALQGLVALGFSVQDAAEALKKVDNKLPPSERIKQALKT
ncbi:MAG: Holliday junction DNA helicase, subunit A [Candidatus Saccharibacteria bacterium GW2011_GWA2_46_10]|nr:MAG: Holliday junction DNA helicase, subunit A [Candidatus Saccharibacteria bacterium GW2011_GWA2_46_10]